VQEPEFGHAFFHKKDLRNPKYQILNLKLPNRMDESTFDDKQFCLFDSVITPLSPHPLAYGEQRIREKLA
jgi:hypothetical protein